MDNEILTADEAAQLLQVTPETVVDLLKSSELPGRKVGGQWRTTKRALVHFIDGLSEGGSMCCPPGMCCPAPSAKPSATAGN